MGFINQLITGGHHPVGYIPLHPDFCCSNGHFLVDAMQAAALDAACGVPRSAGARLVLDTMSADFRDVLPRITLPTLCIGRVWGWGWGGGVDFTSLDFGLE